MFFHPVYTVQVAVTILEYFLSSLNSSWLTQHKSIFLYASDQLFAFNWECLTENFIVSGEERQSGLLYGQASKVVMFCSHTP